MDTVQKVCSSCKNLAVEAATGFEINDDGECNYIAISPKAASEAAEAGCPICSILLRAAQHVVQEKTGGDLHVSDLHELDVTHSRPPDIPLTLTCWENRFQYITTQQFLTVSDLPAPYSHFTPVPVVSQHSDSPQCFEQIGQWIAQCEAGHEDCKAPDAARLPTRVVDLNPVDGSLKPFLLEINGAVSGRYAALSYVWGDTLPLMLTRAVLESFKSGITWSDIPKTLQDAMTITHRLGLRYLWVDALTIIQDDEADWKAEAAKMATVYGNAYITISATKSKNCQDGILSSRSGSARHILVWPMEPGQLPREVDVLREGEIYARESWGSILLGYPLHQRAWALQECILPRRVVQYVDDELVWNCRSGRASESRPTLINSAKHTNRTMDRIQPTHLPVRDTIDIATARDLLSFWAECVQNYTFRRLTRESDKLPAISGIVQAFQASGMGRCYAGLWEMDFLVGLTWASEPSISNADGGFKPSHVRPRHPRAPSWSWASIDGMVAYRSDRLEYLRPPLAQCHVLALSDTEIVLRGRVVNGALNRTTTCVPEVGHDNEISGCHHSLRSELVIGDITNIFTATNIIDTTPMHPEIGAPPGLCETPVDVICLLLGVKPTSGDHPGWATALILVRSDTRSDAYERVGINDMLKVGCFEEATEREVTII